MFIRLKKKKTIVLDKSEGLVIEFGNGFFHPHDGHNKDSGGILSTTVRGATKYMELFRARDEERADFNIFTNSLSGVSCASRISILLLDDSTNMELDKQMSFDS